MLMTMVDILAKTSNTVPLFSPSLTFPRGSDLSLKENLKVIGRKYKSGALYYGAFEANKRAGEGVFKWPSGSVYEGEYVDNLRHGSGKLTWRDGGQYVGSFCFDSREGHGKLKWKDGQTYEGEFFNDKKHGQGTYTWSDGSYYVGYFAGDKKCGFGTFYYSDGRKFEGFYLNDKRDGPGVLSYTDGKQDVGLWDDEKLVSLCTILESKFDAQNVRQHSINSSADNKFNISPEQQNICCALDNLCSQMKLNQDELKRQIPEHFHLCSILCGERKQFGPGGATELMSEDLLKCCTLGNACQVKQILSSKNVSPDVSDFTGHSALLSASVNCHLKVINILLDYGANINKVNDQGLSALSACHLLLYTDEIFVDNIAENMPNENQFNAIQWDKQKSLVFLRNDRQMILDLYESARTSSGRTTSSKKSRPRSRLISISSSCITKGSEGNPDEILSDEEDDRLDEAKRIKEWKLNYFHQSINRIKELEAINRNFQNFAHFKSNQDFEGTAFSTDQELVGSRKEELKSVPCGDFDIAHATDDFSDARNSQLINTSMRSVFEVSHFNTARKTALSRKLDIMRRKLINVERKPHLESVINLLLLRGANPNVSSVPLPPLFYAVKAANVKAVESLLLKGANALVKLGNEHCSLTPLHIAAALPCSSGIEITRLLLKAGADPNCRDNIFHDNEGRTPLQIACCREDDNKQAQQVLELLLSYNADPNVTCHGHSPLTLAIASGNDLAVDVLLRYGANPSLRLPHGVGSALCAATAFSAERRRKASERLKLIDKLVKAGADLLAPVTYCEKLGPGTVVDYAYYVFSQDRRIAHTPYHALSSAERECHNSRKELLEHLGELLRTAALKRENELLEEELNRLQELAVSDDIDVSERIGKPTVTFELSAGRNGLSKTGKKTLLSDDRVARSGSNSSGRFISPNSGCGLRFTVVKACDAASVTAFVNDAFNKKRVEAKRKFRYCYECGRSVGLRLNSCSRCKEVFFCSKPCKLKAWTARHKEECLRIAGSLSKSPKPPKKDGFPPITKSKKSKDSRVNSYMNSSKHCICDLKKPAC